MIQTYPNEQHLSVYDPMNPRHGCSSCVDCQGCLSTYNACSRYDMVRLGWCSPIAPGFIILRSQERSVNHGLNMFEYGSTLPGSHQRTQGQGCGAGMAWDGLGLQIPWVPCQETDHGQRLRAGGRSSWYAAHRWLPLAASRWWSLRSNLCSGPGLRSYFATPNQLTYGETSKDRWDQMSKRCQKGQELLWAYESPITVAPSVSAFWASNTCGRWASHRTPATYLSICARKCLAWSSWPFSQAGPYDVST